MITIEQENLIHELFQQGVPKTKIAKQIGCSTATVTRHLKSVQIIDPMIGQRFGKLVVISQAERRQDLASRCRRYICQCDCGNIIEVNGNSLRSNHTQSCGCTRKENVPYKDLVGQKFGKLTVISLCGSTKDRHKLWHCKCDCGNECNVSSRDLMDGTTKSCGCLHSYKEMEIINILEKKQINFKKEYTFSDLRGVRNPLRFDFAILDKDNNLQCLIEYNGDQHIDKNNKWYTEQLQDSDKRKKEYCIKHNIPLYIFNKQTNLEQEIDRIIFDD